MAQLAVIGTGFVGTSWALALRKARLFEAIVGYDVDRQHLQAAERIGAIDHQAGTPEAAVERAGLVIVAVPQSELPTAFAKFAGHLAPGAVVTDTAPWKLEALKAAAALPAGVHYVGGRPVLDAAGIGPEQARADAFSGAIYCLTPSAGAAESAVQAVSSLVFATGAQPYFLTPEEHDGLTAATELLLPATIEAVTLGLIEDPAWLEIGRLASDWFERWAQLVERIPPELSREAANNAGVLSRWIDVMIGRLEGLKEDLAAQPDEDSRLRRVRSALDRWRSTKRQLRDSSMPSMQELRPNLLGSKGALERLRGRPPGPRTGEAE